MGDKIVIADSFNLALVIIMLFGSNKMYSLFRDRFGNIVVGIGTFAAYMFCLSNYYWGLPMIDFRPYAVGKNIKEEMQLPPGAVKDSVAMVFIYEKDGKKVELSNPAYEEWVATDQQVRTEFNFKYVKFYPVSANYLQDCC